MFQNALLSDSYFVTLLKEPIDNIEAENGKPYDPRGTHRHGFHMKTVNIADALSLALPSVKLTNNKMNN